MSDNDEEEVLGLCDDDSSSEEDNDAYDDSSDEDDDQFSELISNSREIAKRLMECNSGETAKKSRER
jgi:hypothetical protein